jgi:two-component system sensor histidine kinase KdpD
MVMEGKRQTPEQLLQRVQEEERNAKRGKLKIYLGAAPGVGKTYEMLHDALEKRAKELDVVVGVVESHGREDIELFLKNFEIIPRQSVEYHGKECLEFDLVKTLQRNPGIVLVDEMAHTNAPGLRHAKRWQDINELLDCGIDVYTTLNVQHIESLNDIVIQIIRAPVKETVPDTIIERADTIELVDLPPDDLLKRLDEGKVYIPDQAKIAREHFFRKGNLIALRELALRIAAEYVGAEVLLYRKGEGIRKVWPTKDKILVCVGSRVDSLKLIRAAKRIANGLQVEWIAVYVDTPKLQGSAVQRNAAIENLRLAESLGAETHVLMGDDIVKDVLEFSREQNVTQILIRKHIVNRFQSWFTRNLADEMIRQSGEIDIYVMTSSPNDALLKKNFFSKITPWKAYASMICIVLLATLVNFKLYSFVSSGYLVLTYVLSILAIASFGRLMPIIVASIASLLAYAFFFISPYFSFSITENEYIFIFVVLIITVQIISYLIFMLKKQANSARVIQHQTTALYTLSRQLMKTRGIDKLLDLGTRYIGSVFNCEVMALIPKGEHLVVRSNYQSKPKLDIKEQGIAQWVYEMGQRAGLSTDTLSFSNALYLPLIASHGSIGVLRIQPQSSQLFTPEQIGLLETCLYQLALAVDVERFQEKERKRELKIEADRARNSLLQAISHNLSPLNLIVTGVEQSKNVTDPHKKIVKDIDFEIESLSRLNNNILQSIQLESQSHVLEKTKSSLQEIISFVVKSSNKILKGRPIHLSIPNDLPLVPLNRPLIQSVIINLIDNAVKYTPAETPIAITVYIKQDMAIISIEDSGSGIALDERDKLFEKFYRGKRVISARGLGLGLAICEKIVLAHGGRIWVENASHQGANFCFSLPLIIP